MILKNDEEEKKDDLSPGKNRKRKNSKNIEDYFDEKNYYCKDLDLYIAMEPCIMCSMALGIYYYGFAYYQLKIYNVVN